MLDTEGHPAQAGRAALSELIDQEAMAKLPEETYSAAVDESGTKLRSEKEWAAGMLEAAGLKTDRPRSVVRLSDSDVCLFALCVAF